MRPFIIFGCMILLLVSLTACPAKKEGAIEGVVVPPSEGIRLTVAQQGKTIATVEVNAQDGKFRSSLPAGTYDLKLTAPASPYPLVLPGIIVKPAETTTLTPIDLVPSKGSAVITGKIQSAAAERALHSLPKGSSGRRSMRIQTESTSSRDFQRDAIFSRSVLLDTPMILSP
jgi:hypothetical protein